MTTYVAFGIRLYWLGSEVDISTVSHNDDYIFIYEDPVHYYSQYRRPLEGSYFVGENGETTTPSASASPCPTASRSRWISRAISPSRSKSGAPAYPVADP